MENVNNVQVKVDLLAAIKTLSEQDNGVATTLAADFITVVKEFDSAEVMLFVDAINKVEYSAELADESAKKIIDLINGVKLLQAAEQPVACQYLVTNLLQELKSENLQADSIVALAQCIDTSPNIEVSIEAKEEKRERLSLLSSIRRGRKESYKELCSEGYNVWKAPTVRGWCSGAIEYYFPKDATLAENAINAATYARNIAGIVATATGPVGVAAGIAGLVVTPLVSEVPQEAKTAILNLYNSRVAPTTTPTTEIENAAAQVTEEKSVNSLSL
jgi:hypothetical protein